MLIECRDLWKIFGSSSSKHGSEALEAARRGVSRDELMERFKCVLALAGISFSVEEGESFVVMGLSGSGKSTLVRHLNRLVEPTAGSVLVAGRDLSELDDTALRRLRSEQIGMVFQHDALLPHRSVIDNVAFGLELRGVDKAERHNTATHALELVQLEGWQDRQPSELSGGMRQRVGLARALVADPPILLLDEPFGALDPLIRGQLQEEFQRLSRELGKTSVFITHDLDEALKIGDRIAILRDGALVQLGTPEEIVASPADDYVARFVSGLSTLAVMTARSVVGAAGTAGRSLEDGPRIDAETPLAELLRISADNDAPLVVVDDGETIGTLEHSDVLRSLSRQYAPTVTGDPT